MGSAASRDETVKCEINDFDSKHKAMFKKIEQALHEERRLTVQERKDLDDKVNNFVRKNLKNREDQFMSDMERVMNIAKTDKITRDDQYRGIMDAWLSIIKSHDMELSDSVRDGLVRDMEAVYAKDKQISDFTYEREVLAALENDLYADKLVRDNLYRELMVQIADAIKTANQEMYRKHSGTTYHLENQLSVKDKEFQIKNGIAVKQKFETVFQNTTKTGIELVKQKGRVSDIVREDKAEVDKKRQQYGKILAAAIHSDQHWVDDHSTQLINKLDRLITDYRGRITSLNREMAPHVCRTVWKGEDCLYQRYRAMKYSCFEVIRGQVDLADRRKTEIVERIGEHRRVFKASNEGVLATQHADVEASCNRVFLEDNEDRTEAHCTLLFSELKNMVNEEKEHLDKQRSAVSRHLEDLIKKDQQLSDEKVKEMILKIETLYAVDEDGTGKVAAAGAGGVPVVTAA